MARAQNMYLQIPDIKVHIKRIKIRFGGRGYECVNFSMWFSLRCRSYFKIDMWRLYKFVYGHVFTEGFMFRGTVNNTCLHHSIGKSLWNRIVLASAFYRLIYMHVSLYRNIANFLNLTPIILYPLFLQLSATWFDIAHQFKYISYKKKVNDIFLFKK